MKPAIRQNDPITIPLPPPPAKTKRKLAPLLSLLPPTPVHFTQILNRNNNDRFMTHENIQRRSRLHHNPETFPIASRRSRHSPPHNARLIRGGKDRIFFDRGKLECRMDGNCPSGAAPRQPPAIAIDSESRNAVST